MKGHPVAVCGATEDRHGIVPAKNYEAKKYKIQIGEVVWQDTHQFLRYIHQCAITAASTLKGEISIITAIILAFKIFS